MPTVTVRDGRTFIARSPWSGAETISLTAYETRLGRNRRADLTLTPAEAVEIARHLLDAADDINQGIDSPPTP